MLMVKSLTHSVLLVNIYWQKLLDSLLVQLVVLDSQLVPLGSAEVQLVFLEREAVLEHPTSFWMAECAQHCFHPSWES